MSDSDRIFSLKDGSFKEHPWVKGLLMSPHISEKDLEDFWKTPHERITVAKKEIVVDCEKDSLKIMIVTTGWLFSYSILPDGKRLIHRLYREGDIIGDDDFSREQNSFNVKSATEARLINVQVPACRSLLVNHNHLLTYLSHHLAYTLLITLDHTKSIARLNPEACLAHFILSILSRVRLTSSVPNLDLILLPLTQNIIGDYLGLTSVHVSRTMKSLTKSGYIARPSLNLIRVLDEPALIEMCDFKDRNDALKAKINL